MVNRQANARDARSAIQDGNTTATRATAMESLGSVPNPDPTLRTVEQLLREIANARELIEAKVGGNFATLGARIDGLDARLVEARDIGDRHTDIAIKDLKDAIETRLNAMDKVVDKLPSMYDRLSVITDEKILQLKYLHEEKFQSIGVQFAERDTRTEQTAAGVKIAVDAALQAAKEAVAEQNRSFALATGKSETATMKQIDALGLAIQTANKGLDDKIADMKDRLTRIEGMDLGASRRDSTAHETTVERHGSSSLFVAMVSAAIGFLGLACAIAGWVYTASRTTPPTPVPVYQAPPMAPHVPSNLERL